MISPDVLGAKQKPTARSLLAVGSVDLFTIALLSHPIPSSRRHVIRVDMPVPVDVIRFAFWMVEVMKRLLSNSIELSASALGKPNSKYR